MRANGGGAIINIASVHALAPGPACFAYATMKTAMIGMTRSMAVGLGRHNIRVNAVVPSATRTSGLAKAWGEERDPHGQGTAALYQWAAEQHPMRRIAEVARGGWGRSTNSTPPPGTRRPAEAARRLFYDAR